MLSTVPLNDFGVAAQKQKFLGVEIIESTDESKTWRAVLGQIMICFIVI